MNDLEFMQCLYDGYILNFRKLSWGKKGTYSDWTHGDLMHFKQLGEALGFQSVLEYKKIDLVWLNKDSQIYLYLERENEDGKLARTIEKLLKESTQIIPAPRFIIGVFGWIKRANHKKIIESIKSLFCTSNILLISSIGENQDSCKAIYGDIFVNEEHYSKNAEAKMDAADYWYAFSKQEWK